MCDNTLGLEEEDKGVSGGGERVDVAKINESGSRKRTDETEGVCGGGCCTEWSDD